MSIISIQTVQSGLVGVLPSLAYISTTSTQAAVLTTGYLNKAVQEGTQFSLPCIAVVSTQATPSTAPAVGWYQIVHVGSNWSLISADSPTAEAVLLNPTGNQTIVGNYILQAYNLTGTNSVIGGSLELISNTLTSNAANIWLKPGTTAYTVGAGNLGPIGNAGAVSGAIQSFGGGSGTSGYASGRWVASNAASSFTFYKSRSAALNTFTTVQTNDVLGNIFWTGDDGTQFTEAAAIVVTAVGTISTGVVPGNMAISTNNASGVSTLAVNISDAQVVTLANALVTPGATYTKVNGTEASNAVTASGYSGVITTSSLSTAAGGTYAITWTNTKITATSVITLTVVGGSNSNQNINFTVVPGSGTATLTIFNNASLTALGGTILIAYNVT